MASINAGPSSDAELPDERAYLSPRAQLSIRLLFWLLAGPLGARLLWWRSLGVIGGAGDANANPSQGLTAAQNWAVGWCLFDTAAMPLAHGAALAVLAAVCGPSARGRAAAAAASGGLFGVAAWSCRWLTLNLVQPQNTFNQWPGDNFQFPDFVDVDPLRQILGVRGGPAGAAATAAPHRRRPAGAPPHRRRPRQAPPRPRPHQPLPPPPPLLPSP
jgi:hypothetical protein